MTTAEDEEPVEALRRRCIRSVQRPRWRTPSTTPGRDVPDVFVVVVHPFHPLLGQSFELVVKSASFRREQGEAQRNTWEVRVMVAPTPAARRAEQVRRRRTTRR